MNVYDFDKTIYHGDSTAHFYLFCLKRQPSLLRYFPRQFAAAVAYYVFKKRTKTQMKEVFYLFLRNLRDVDESVEAFWDAKQGNIKAFYQETRRKDDLIISASPEFLLEPLCKREGIRHLMASRVDKKTGKYDGLNCHGEEKVRRFYEARPDGTIDDFYSDSDSDLPLARLAKRSFKVTGDRVEPWTVQQKGI